MSRQAIGVFSLFLLAIGLICYALTMRVIRLEQAVRILDARTSK